MQAQNAGGTQPRRTLNEETVRTLWQKTYNTLGKPDWSHLFPYYHEEIVFQDSIQRVQGKERFMALCNRLAERCRQLNMELHTLAVKDNEIIFDWTMTMMFKRFPSTPIYGCTKLTLHEDGRIIRQRDYYDLWGDIFNGIPWFRKPYRRFIRRKFG
ncbi:MAG: nuclear transport factor 2 family protein [Clostridiales bacterium]|nr:nuclear transport factor 2 family protein [Clostridiales bacterium]